MPSRAWYFLAYRRPRGLSTKKRANTITTASTPISRTSTRAIRKCEPRSRGSSRPGCNSASRGFRVDALPFVISSKGPGVEAFGDHPEYLIDMRQVLSWSRGDAVFMAEANLPPDQVPMYFGDGERVHMIFNFFVNQHLWLAMAREQAQPVRDAYRALPKIPKYLPVGQFSANARRIRPGTAERRGAAGGIREVRSGAEHATVRARHPPPDGADAG